MANKFIRVKTQFGDVIFLNVDHIHGVCEVTKTSCNVITLKENYFCDDMSAEYLVERINMINE